MQYLMLFLLGLMLLYSVAGIY